jgi:hypothetical protein
MTPMKKKNGNASKMKVIARVQFVDNPLNVQIYAIV